VVNQKNWNNQPSVQWYLSCPKMHHRIQQHRRLQQIVDNRLRQEGRFKVAEERVRRMQDRDKHVKNIKKLTKNDFRPVDGNWMVTNR
jgi:hypothetical protein